MDKYIDIELLKAQFDKHCEQVGESVDDWGMFYEEFPRMLADIPSADVQPVVHAHWKYDKNGVFWCSRCECIPATKSKFCPLCGAKMDGN